MFTVCPKTTEQLEPRLLLAASTAEYYPLTETSRWEYDVTEEDGGRDTLNVKVARGTQRINRQDANRVVYSFEDERVQTLQNINEKGKLLFHGGYIDGGELLLQPPVRLPATLREGVVKRTTGDIDIEYEGFEGDGDYTATVRIGREKPVNVPAGTFSAVRVRVDIDFEAEEEIIFGEGPEAGGHLTHVMWLARGVGVVRAEQRYEVDADLIIDEERRSGGSVQLLRSYAIADAGAARARAVVAAEPDDPPARRRETPDLLA